jgi:hypothetical protein
VHIEAHDFVGVHGCADALQELDELDVPWHFCTVLQNKGDITLLEFTVAQVNIDFLLLQQLDLTTGPEQT